MLIGRKSELRALHERIDAVHQSGGAIVLRGEGGIGKSSLLEQVRRHATARGLRTLATAGVESERQLPFAALHHLLLPVLGELDGLPDSQRDAVRVAFGLSDGPPPAPFLLALAALHLLGEVAARTPILVLVDDAQWLDPSSADALAFVARRLEADSAILLLAIRDGFPSVLLEAGLPELPLSPLGEPDASALLDARAPGLEPALRERILGDAAGNPLALVELPLALRSAGIVEAGSPPLFLPLTARLERAFAARSSELPSSTRTLLLVAAADENAPLADLLRAASEIESRELTLDAVAPAVSAGLVEIDGPQLRFRHPLMRSAIHERRNVAERAAVHAALAAVARDPDRRVWHRAAAVIGTDEKIADELDDASARAHRRGAGSIALDALLRAAALTDDPARRGARLVRAGELAFEFGRHADVPRLAREAERCALTTLDELRLAYLRELIGEGSWSGAARVAGFVEIAERMRLDGDPDRALAALNWGALRYWWSNPDAEARAQVIAAAERIPVAESDPRLIAILALAGPTERGAVVVDRLSRMTLDAGVDATVLHDLGTAATGVGDFAAAERFLEQAVAGMRAQGRLNYLAQALVSQAWTWLHRGRWQQARLAASEAARLAEETQQPLWVTVAQLAQATVSAYEGDTDAALDLASAGEKVLLPIGAHPMLALVQLPRGAAGVAAGQYAEGYEHLRRIFDPAQLAFHPGVRVWALVDLVEAAVHVGNEGEAGAMVRELEPLARRTRSPLLRAALDFARPVLADDARAEAAFRRGLGERLAAWPFYRARLELAYGAWLRRRRRMADSRAPLRAARDAFDALGAGPWSERARQELRASGETSRGRTLESADALSSQELQIAQMVADGMSNKEIGRQLYLSHRTIGTHLYRIFPKLGISARSQLRAALERRSADS